MPRPVGFSQEIANQVIDRIAEGEMLTKVCEDESMPTKKQFRYWLSTRDDLAASYARARLSWADHWAERVMDISFNPQGAIDGQGNAILDHATIALLKLQTDNVKWLVGKWAPRIYGDRSSDEPEKPIVTIGRIERVIIAPTPAEPPAPPPPALTYQRHPGDLSRQDWLLLGEVLDLIKRVQPVNDDRPPAEILEVIRRALLAHFSELAETSSA